MTCDVAFGKYEGKQTKHSFEAVKHSFRACEPVKKAPNLLVKAIADITKNFGFDARVCPIKVHVNCF